nr:PilZ domain-containing protein [Thioalkalivibrio sp. XN279]
MPEREHLDRREERNFALLSALAFIEHGPGRRAEDPAPLAGQLEHLEAKFDLVLAMLSEVLMPDGAGPDLARVTLSGDGVALETDAPVDPGTAVEIDLYLSTIVPRPVRLAGVVRPNLSPGSDAMVVEFRRIGPRVREQLQQLVFRRHRRTIARQRPNIA